ncbi:hypothetical protein [Sorangium sp. So ce233]|uniref:hypothetical protein n=1 Tax=Sorangium sp. So ce233 TaxID=3133290 RepID=UPI003F5E7421
MPRISDATLRAQIPTALLIGGDQALLQRCQAAAMDVGIIVKACPVSMAAALAEERRPVAIVVTSSTYALAPDGFEDIAREVLSTLVRVDEALTDDELGAMLTTAARESRKQRTRQLTPGRYSLMPADDGASGPRSERWSIGVMTADASSRRDAEATPLPRSGPRSAGAQEHAYRERVAAAVSAQRPAEAAAPRSERIGVMSGFGAGPSSSRPQRDPPAPAGVVYARRETPVPPQQQAPAYLRRDTPVVGSQPAHGYPAREMPPAAPYARRDTPAPITQRAGGYPRHEAQAGVTGARREMLAPSSWPGAPSSRPAAPSSWPGAPSSRPAAPSSWPGAPSSRPAAPSSWPGAPSSRREAQAVAAPLRRETLAPSSRPAAPGARRHTPVPLSQRAAAQPRHDAAGVPPAAVPSPREAPASGAPGEEACGLYPTPPPPSSRCAPPSSRRAQFHVDIALLFDERGLPRSDPQEK